MTEESTATINFSITKCPIAIHEAFVNYCKKETNDNYSFGLKLLLDGMKGNVKEVTLYEQYLELKKKVEVMEKKING